MFVTEHVIAWRWIMVFVGLISPSDGERYALEKHGQPFIAVQLSGEFTDIHERVRVRPIWPRWRTECHDARSSGSRLDSILFVQMHQHDLYGWEWSATTLVR